MSKLNALILSPARTAALNKKGLRRLAGLRVVRSGYARTAALNRKGLRHSSGVLSIAQTRENRSPEQEGITTTRSGARRGGRRRREPQP